MAKSNIPWQEKVRGFFKGTKKVINQFMAWFKVNVEPSLLEFLETNKDIAIQIVLEVAEDFADASASNAAKRKEALSRIDDHLLESLPDLKTPDHWLSLLLEIAVAVLKASGKI